MSTSEAKMGDEAYIGQLKTEKETIDPSFSIAIRLLGEEIERVEKRGRYTVIHQEKKVRTLEKVLIPVNQYPKHNFVGKLLGPAGSTLKNLQTETGTKMSILGKGSMKDKKKEEELRKEGDAKNYHLNEDLHLCVEVFSTPTDGHSRIAHALLELEKFLVPDSELGEEIRQQQMIDLSYINGGDQQQQPQPVGRGGRGGAPPLLAGRGGPPPGGMAMRGRGGPTMRGRGAGAPLHQAPSGRGALGLRGRGGPPARGVPTRGAMMGVGRAARPVGAIRHVARPPPQQVYEEETYNTGYEETAYDAYGTDSYENSASYGGSVSDTQYYDYGHVSTGRDTYDEYGAGDHSGYVGQNGYKQSPYKPPPMSRPSSRGNSRAHPYASSGRGARY